MDAHSHVLAMHSRKQIVQICYPDHGHMLNMIGQLSKIDLTS